MNKIICASCYVIDFDNKEVLLTYNEKFNKWIQPGGLIKEKESTLDSAMRGVKELTGVECEIVNTLFENEYMTPVDVVEMQTPEGDVLNIEYLAAPVSKDITPGVQASWFDIYELVNNQNVDESIKYKVNTLYKLFKNDNRKRIRRN